MKIRIISNQTFGKGTNPEGGVCVRIFPESVRDFREFFEAENPYNISDPDRPGMYKQIPWPEDKINERIAGAYEQYRIWKDVYARNTSHDCNIPVDGGPNSEWDKLTRYLGDNPIRWVKQHEKSR